MAVEDTLSGINWSDAPLGEDFAASNLTIPVASTYNNAFLMLTKYAEMSIGVRNGVYVQGLVILSACVYLFYKKEYFLTILVSCFCLVMTAVLQILHKHYNAYFFSVREYIRFLEALYCKHLPVGYVDFVEKARDRRVGTGRFGWMRNHGSFYLIGASAIAIALASAAELLIPPTIALFQTHEEAAEPAPKVKNPA